MVGVKSFVITTDTEKFFITLRRKYTILTGDTGTGKSYIQDAFDLATDEDNDVVKLDADFPVYMLKTKGDLAYYCTDEEVEPGVCFIDELSFINTEMFATLTRDSTHYFLIVSRSSLEMLPYSVKEIYELKSYKTKNCINTEMRPVYRFDDRMQFEPEIVITEDSNSGHQFFQHVFPNAEVISAGGKSNVSEYLSTMLQQGKTKILAIADGAAYGSNVDKLCDALTVSNVKKTAEVCVFLPESFEWLILSSDMFSKFKIDKNLTHTEDYAETSKYISWETYYTALLVELSQNYHIRYTKSKLSKLYLSQSDKIMDVVRRMI